MITQIELIRAITTAITNHGTKNLNIRQCNTVIQCATEIIDELNKKTVTSSEGIGLIGWLSSDDTGTSSRYMATVIHGGSAPLSEPLDPSDFGRCYRLIRAVPGTKEGLHLLRDKSKYWELLVDNWNHIEKAYEEQLEDSKKGKQKIFPCCNLMQHLKKQAEVESI
jgi:hypothetical protein